MVDFFKTLFDYNQLCNRKLAEAIIDNQSAVSENVVKLYSHILDAHQIWNNRIDPQEKTFSVWQIHPITDFSRLDQVNHMHSNAILEVCDLDAVLNYRNSKGQAFTSSTRDILFHIINHSTYHRAQIATAFRQDGLEPLMTDYIFYRR